MENITMNPMTIPSCWQLALSAIDQATAALVTPAVQGIAVRPVMDVAFATCAADAVAAVTAVKRDRAATGTDHGRQAIAAVVPGTSAWSPPN